MIGMIRCVYNLIQKQQAFHQRSVEETNTEQHSDYDIEGVLRRFNGIKPRDGGIDAESLVRATSML